MADLMAEVASTEWYHTIELAPGVVTPGWHDTRPVAAQVPMPSSLAGWTCLDVGTFDGFWAFEMERRGADRVVAIDVPDPRDWDWPFGSDPKTLEVIGRRKGRGFEIASSALGSRVERVERSVYDVDDSLGGPFDLVYVGSLLVHLRDPVRALERLRSVCRRLLVVVDGVDLVLSTVLPTVPAARLDGLGRPWWWYPNLAGIRRLVEAGGFEVTGEVRRIYMPPGAAQALPPRRPKLLLSREGRRALTIATLGDPHAALSARPRGDLPGRP